ncbi:hypothetical protein PGT21_024180 [Puccinia graminis f. sp. tritici]|uniref:Uncharacterized protein n=1 Tax=Puccinia graminis f. sp. tritici TaxID=56615 RepID=A0A5B0N9B4_PUCGR|nr:hypothetical protein PGT21_024180 [Puccinia graminis f. sp. tritici]KAA1113756.1 hypothetical protein PGTUg99_015610 [Puccinia graminis f. sp. tritici]
MFSLLILNWWTNTGSHIRLMGKSSTVELLDDGHHQATRPGRSIFEAFRGNFSLEPGGPAAEMLLSTSCGLRNTNLNYPHTCRYFVSSPINSIHSLGLGATY